MVRYTYSGPVFMFGRVICNKYSTQTSAISERKALSNIAYQYKKKNNLVASALITLDAKCLK